MKPKRYTDEQIAFALRQAEGGTAVEEICRIGLLRLLVQTRVLLAVTVPPALPSFGCASWVMTSLDECSTLTLAIKCRWVAPVWRSPRRSPPARARSQW